MTMELKDFLSKNNAYYYHFNTNDKYSFLQTNGLKIFNSITSHSTFKRVAIDNKTSSFIFVKANLTGVIITFENLTYILHCSPRNKHYLTGLEFYLGLEPI